jgi:adenylate cyclase
MQAAPGLGSISLEVATDGVVRTVPIFVRAGPHLLPGLAVELVRLATHASTYLLRETTLQIGPETVPLGPDARLTIRPTTAASWPDRTVSAIAALSGHTGFEGRIVLIGAGPPAIGTFWRTPASADAPSVQIQADAVETLLSGHIPHRPSWAAPTEIAATALLALLAISAAVELAPVIAVAAAAAACLLYAAAASAALLRFDIILDPVTPALLGIAVAATAGLVAVSEARRAARRLRNRFEQHLAPAIVARIAAQPGLERIAGERRDVTALFTDLEGFTAATERMDPAVLVAILNRYFDIVVRTVIDHDGTVDKIIGDAVLAIFNAPTDLPDHPTSAVRCALALAASTREFASDPANDGLGQTRIGIETGEALVGEVGGDGKLNYTAHGAAINTAARLQSLNKQTGSTICVGPACRARIQTIAFRSLGSVDIRGSGPLEAFSPEPTPSLPRPAPSPIS